jgi:hypothetical protein
MILYNMIWIVFIKIWIVFNNIWIVFIKIWIVFNQIWIVFIKIWIVFVKERRKLLAILCFVLYKRNVLYYP